MRKSELVCVKHKDSVDDGSLSVFGAIGGLKKDGDSVLYNRWYKLLSRCYNKDDKCYAAYGGEGVTVCKRWHTFSNFLKDVQKMPTFDLSLELDKDLLGAKQYGPTTCLFLSSAANKLLKAMPVKVSFNNEEHWFLSINDAGRELNISPTTLKKYLSSPNYKSNNPRGKVAEIYGLKVVPVKVKGYTIVPRVLAERLKIPFEELL